MKGDTFIHLCQPDANKSCGACCGLYNYADSSEASLILRLRRRTDCFRKTVRTTEDLPLFSDMVKISEDQTKIYEVIHCCEYLGFLDDEGKKVGCLLHPQQGGIDLRDVSFYGKDLCSGHLCPSYNFISREEKQALISIIDDWYLYGLCLTDIDLVTEYFRMISNGVSEMPSPEKFRKGVLKDVALRFFSLKITWPFRSSAVNRFGKYYFDGSQYMISYIDYSALGCEKSRFDRIFMSLCSEFKNVRDLKRGESLIQANFDEFVHAYSSLINTQ